MAVSDPSEPGPPEDAGTRPQPTTREIPVVPPGAAAQQLPPHPGATAPGPVPPPLPFAEPVVPVAPPAVPVAPPAVPMSDPIDRPLDTPLDRPLDTAHPTGPVGFVPGLPDAGNRPPPPAPSGPTGATAVAGPVWPDTLESEHQTAARTRPERDPGALLAAGLALVAVVLLELGLSLRFGTERLWSVTTLWSGFATLATVVAAVALVGTAFSRLAPGVATRIAVAGLAGLAVFWLLVVLGFADTDRGFLLTAAPGCLGAALWARTRARN
jgi:hypothetical protein